MPVHASSPTRSLSRRRLLALTGGASAATILGQAPSIAKQAQESTPAAGNPPAEFPLSSKLAADASPEF